MFLASVSDPRSDIWHLVLLVCGSWHWFVPCGCSSVTVTGQGQAPSGNELGWHPADKQGPGLASGLWAQRQNKLMKMNSEQMPEWSSGH